MLEKGNGKLSVHSSQEVDISEIILNKPKWKQTNEIKERE